MSIAIAERHFPQEDAPVTEAAKTALDEIVSHLDCTHFSSEGKSFIHNLTDGTSQCARCKKVFTRRGDHFVLRNGSLYAA